jgi:Peptidase family M28
MKLAKYYLEPNNRSTQLNTAASLGASWVQFGNELLIYADGDQWESLVGRSDLPLQENLATINRKNMHVVVQKGRLFQQKHPEVPVITDHGRFLLIDIDPDRAQQLQTGDIPCYTILPLEDNQVVFDISTTINIASRETVSQTQQLVNKVSRSSFEADLTHLVSYPTRLSTSQYYADAANWVVAQLQEMNYDTQLQNITINSDKSQNVIADKQGVFVGARDLILVTAHLDSINLDDNSPMAIAPGADDNGSGSAGVLQIARVFQSYANVHDLRFVFFGGEEQGLFGSKQYVDSLSVQEQKRIRAVVNMDMIGSLNGDVPTVLLEGAPLSQSVIDGLATAAETYTKLTVQTSIQPFASDHVSFIDKGIPAVLTIEGADGENESEHSSRDTIDRINYDLALEILRMNIAFIANTSS